MYDMWEIRDNHIKTLVTRCNKITDLDLGGRTSLTRQSLNFITEKLQLTIGELSLDFTDISYDLSKLESLEKLKSLYYHHEHWNHAQHIWFKRKWKKRYPNLMIISSPGGEAIIASPCQPDHRQGIWEIKAEQEELHNSPLHHKFQFCKCFKKAKNQIQGLSA